MSLSTCLVKCPRKISRTKWTPACTAWWVTARITEGCKLCAACSIPVCITEKDAVWKTLEKQLKGLTQILLTLLYITHFIAFTSKPRTPILNCISPFPLLILSRWRSQDISNFGYIFHLFRDTYTLIHSFILLQSITYIALFAKLYYCREAKNYLIWFLMCVLLEYFFCRNLMYST